MQRLMVLLHVPMIFDQLLRWLLLLLLASPLNLPSQTRPRQARSYATLT